MFFFYLKAFANPRYYPRLRQQEVFLIGSRFPVKICFELLQFPSQLDMKANVHIQKIMRSTYPKVK